MILLDSDVAVDVLRGLPAALAWFGVISGEHEIVVPGYVAMELIFGCRDRQDRRGCTTLLQACQLAWLDESNCQGALDLLASIRPCAALGVIDALVAQTARVMHIPLHTFNRKHYGFVPELELVEPYKR
ncbi:MAG: PIN domain-containing protein [Tepidisphaeraceae bacterium]